MRYGSGRRPGAMSDERHEQLMRTLAGSSSRVPPVEVKRREAEIDRQTDAALAPSPVADPKLEPESVVDEDLEDPEEIINRMGACLEQILDLARASVTRAVVSNSRKPKAMLVDGEVREILKLTRSGLGIALDGSQDDV